MLHHTGIIRRIDELGRIVIPKNIRAKYGIEENDAFELIITDNSIILEKYSPEAAWDEEV